MNFMKDKTFIIAELSANHNHKLDIAIKTIEAAKKAGADAIKVQTYTADTMTINCNNEYFRIKQGTIWDGKTLYELYKEAYTPWEWHPKLKKVAEDLGLLFFSTPFDKTAVDFLEKLNVPMYKIASFEIVDIPLIEYTASKGKPIIISTGIAKLSEIEDALNACKKNKNDKITLLKCTSSYPAPIAESNLLMIPDIKQRFGVKVGLSDHTIGADVSIAAVAIGATVIEKHFILDRALGGLDSSFSMEPKEFKSMVNSIRNVENALGRTDYTLTPKLKKSRKFMRSLFAVTNIKKGEIITNINVRAIRPGDGISPKFMEKIEGKKACLNIKTGTPITLKMIKTND